VIQEAWVSGVSTRRVDDLVQAMGLAGISKSTVSKLCRGHWQVNRLGNKLGLVMRARRALSYLLDRRLLSPSPKCFRLGTAITDSTEAMTSWPEVTVDDGVR
jgi:hypothetical protein